MDTAALELVITHLNAPYGEIVLIDDLTAVLRDGTTAAIARRKPDAASILSQLFVEVSPALVGRCMVAVGATFASVQALYAESIGQAGRVPAWERAVAHL